MTLTSGDDAPKEWTELADAHGCAQPEPLAHAWEGNVKLSAHGYHPVLHRQRVPEGFSVDKDEQGTAFFVCTGPREAVFLTAKHVVATHSREKPFGLMLIHADMSTFDMVPIRALDLHPTLDVAIGLVQTSAFPAAFRVGRRKLQPNEPFIALGYPSTQAIAYTSGDGSRVLAMNYTPAEVHGIVENHQEDQRGFQYLHATRLAGGMSGGPLISPVDGRAYAITSVGIPGVYELAVDIEQLFDWQVSFLPDGMRFGDLIRSVESSLGA